MVSATVGGVLAGALEVIKKKTNDVFVDHF
jgi:hypothetical protein